MIIRLLLNKQDDMIFLRNYYIAEKRFYFDRLGIRIKDFPMKIK